MNAPSLEAPEYLLQAINGALSIFYKNPLLSDLHLKVEEGPYSITVTVIGPRGTANSTAEDIFIGDSRWLLDDLVRRPQELAKTAAVKALAEYTKENVYWGCLEGVRPGRLYQLLINRGFSKHETELIFKYIYGVNVEKTRLLANLYEKQKSLCNNLSRGFISLYVGIPFCPTRCTYCSFAAYPLKTHGHLKKQYLKALNFELKEIISFCQSNNLMVRSVYIGGGTPTSLTAEELQSILEIIPKTDELTIEAGRPDTFDSQKLAVFKKAGVDRVSVNPQTLNERTLKLIGRDHTVEQFYQAVDEVRKAKIPVLNIDLIAGLPGEGLADMAHTIEKILELSPENVTVHTLALKRASTWYKQLESWSLPSAQVTEKMVEKASNSLISANLQPYYMYRQRHMAANLENIGYAKPGTECYYNIVMIEELETVVGVGAGASTRFVGDQISRVVNPKCPSTYAQRVEELIKVKQLNLAQLISLD